MHLVHNLKHWRIYSNGFNNEMSDRQLMVFEKSDIKYSHFKFIQLKFAVFLNNSDDSNNPFIDFPRLIAIDTNRQSKDLYDSLLKQAQFALTSIGGPKMKTYMLTNSKSIKIRYIA